MEFPKGSILGPLLFVIYMNELPKVINYSEISLYADDTAIYTYGPNIEILEHNLQDDLIKISEWLVANKLSINPEKCKIMNVCTPNTD